MQVLSPEFYLGLALVLNDYFVIHYIVYYSAGFVCDFDFDSGAGLGGSL
jgi:hypothetical protein